MCDGAGVSFEAVPVTRKSLADRLQAELLSTDLSVPGSQVSFREKIQELQTENARLTRELSQRRGQAATESKIKHRTEEEVKQLMTANQRLQQEAQENAIVAKYFKNSTRKYVEGVNKILPLLEELKPALPPVADQDRQPTE